MCYPIASRFYDIFIATVMEFASIYRYICDNETSSASGQDNFPCLKRSFTRNIGILFGINFSAHIAIWVDVRLPCKVEVSGLDDIFNAPKGYSIRCEKMS